MIEASQSDVSEGCQNVDMEHSYRDDTANQGYAISDYTQIESLSSRQARLLKEVGRVST